MQLYEGWYEKQLAAATKERDSKIKRVSDSRWTIWAFSDSANSWQLEADIGQLRQEIKQRDTRLHILETTISVSFPDFLPQLIRLKLVP